MIRIEQYTVSRKNEWDDLIKSSKNGTFMLQRDYMDYHADRFKDISLMFYEENTLVAVMPCSLHGTEVITHAGLSFGGLITNKKITAAKILSCFDTMKSFFKENKITKLTYKCIPAIYHSYSAEEDLYALFIHNSNLIRRDIASVIYLPEKIKFSKGKGGE